MKSLYIDSMKISVCLARMKMTRSELCKHSGISEANMSTILKRGTARPKTAGLIADALGVDVTGIIVTEDVKKDG